MKYILGMLMLLNTLFANENLHSIYENIILKNVTNAQKVAKTLASSIKEEEVLTSQNDFREFVQAWKSVEAFYILGDLDDNYLDSPRYIDTFHEGNEDIKEQLDLIINTQESLTIALYKNSHKTINALEYVLFAKDIKKARVNAIALIIIDTIQNNLEEIYQGYKESQKLFESDEQKANSMMLNSLIESSYKLKEWRVGDPAGLSRKYKGELDNEKGEYFLSQSSLLAIEAILQTHLKLLSKQKFPNFGTMIDSYGVKDELQNSIEYLNVALRESQSIQNDDFSKAKPLYKSLKKLHVTYYISLIGKLKITSKILDADGD